MEFMGLGTPIRFVRPTGSWYIRLLPVPHALEGIAMAYRFKRKESVPDAIRRVVGEEIDTARSDLARKSGDLHKGVHEARKHFKKIRAILRLARFEIGNETYRRENSWYRDTSRKLSEARDAEAMIEAYDKLRERFGGPFERRSFRAIRKAFVRRRDAMTKDAKAFDRVVADVRADLVEAKERIRDWSLPGSGFAAIGPGLRRIYRNGRRVPSPTRSTIRLPRTSTRCASASRISGTTFGSCGTCGRMSCRPWSRR